MASLPTTAQLKIPALTKINSCGLKYGTVNGILPLAYTEKSTVTKFVTTTPPKATSSTQKNNIVHGKVPAENKVVDIDVLTKLQQQNVGNIVSFTASKEFLSNLTNSKFALNKVANQADFQKSGVKSEQVLIGVSTSKQLAHPSVKFVTQEKLLLPKSQINGLLANRDQHVEVKKFAPEIKGLLTGLSTALKPTATTTNTTQSYQVLRTTNFVPIANVSPSTLCQTKGNVLIAVKTTSKPLQNGIVTANQNFCLPTISTFKKNVTVKPTRTTTAVVQQRQPKLVYQKVSPQKPIHPRQKVSNKQTSPKTVTKHAVINYTPIQNINYLEKASSVSASIDSERIHLFRKNNQIKHEQKNLDVTKYVRVISTASNVEISPSVPIKVVTPLFNVKQRHSNDNNQMDTKTQRVTNSYSVIIPTSSSNASKNTDDFPDLKESLKSKFSKDETTKSITGFVELYEEAVQNVLNIKAFTDEATTAKEENSASYKEFVNAYQQYLETPIELDKKIKRHLAAYYGGKSPSQEPDAKKMKLESSITNIKDSLSAKTKIKEKPIFFSSQDISVSSDLFDFKSLVNSEHRRKKVSRKERDMDNMRFFSQFLSEQPPQNQINSQYSHTDFPWLHPPFLYGGYYPPPFRYYGSPVIRNAINEENSEKLEANNSTEYPRMKLNTVKKLSAVKNEELSDKEELKVSPADEEVKKITKNKKTEKAKSGSNRSTPSQEKEKEKKAKAKEALKFKFKRYTLRQRAIALKKVKQLAIEKTPEPPKFVLKELIGKSVTKKELFLGELGLRRILKRIEKRGKTKVPGANL